MSPRRTPNEILKGLTLPDRGSPEVGSAQIEINEIWREFVRQYGSEADVSRLVRGVGLPIGGNAVITVGLETLLGLNQGPSGPVRVAQTVNIGTVDNDTEVVSAALSPDLDDADDIVIEGVTLSSTGNMPEFVMDSSNGFRPVRAVIGLASGENPLVPNELDLFDGYLFGQQFSRDPRSGNLANGAAVGRFLSVLSGTPLRQFLLAESSLRVARAGKRLYAALRSVIAIAGVTVTFHLAGYEETT